LQNYFGNWGLLLNTNYCRNIIKKTTNERGLIPSGRDGDQFPPPPNDPRGGYSPGLHSTEVFGFNPIFIESTKILLPKVTSETKNLLKVTLDNLVIYRLNIIETDFILGKTTLFKHFYQSFLWTTWLTTMNGPHRKWIWDPAGMALSHFYEMITPFGYRFMKAIFFISSRMM
jgi:hypothetical protein